MKNLKINRQVYILLILIIPFFSQCKKNDALVTPDNSYPQYGTPYANVPNAADAIIYQVNIRAFSAAGDFKGVMVRLDSIKALGTNVIYLMPVYPVGVLKASYGLGSPYAVKDFKVVNTEFGTLEDLRALVNAAHEKGMSVMLDWVANHTSWDNEWIKNKSWYTQDMNGNIISPEGTNWSDVADLNYNNREMRTAMIDAMKYWVFNANIDGFRCDAVDFVPYDFWVEANAALKKISTHTLIMLAEGTRNDHFKAGFQMVYGMGYYYVLENQIFGNGASATRIQDFNTSEYATALIGSQVVRYTTNHDVYLSDGSPVSLMGGKKGSMSAFLVTAFMKGVPMIYSGQEVGSTGVIDYFLKTPINWSTNPDMKEEYKRILKFRSNSKAVKSGNLLAFSSDDVVAFTKTADAEKVMVIANLRGNPVTYDVPFSLVGTKWKNVFTGASITLTQRMTLPQYEHFVLSN